MSEVANSTSHGVTSSPESGSLERRLFLFMVLTVAIAAIVSAMLAPWRVMTGLLLGGLLSLLNHHWLRSSIAVVLGTDQTSKPSPIRAWRFVLRYFVVAAVVYAAYALDLVSLPATIAGLCSVVVALFAEALRVSVFAIIHRGETD